MPLTFNQLHQKLCFIYFYPKKKQLLQLFIYKMLYLLYQTLGNSSRIGDMSDTKVKNLNFGKESLVFKQLTLVLTLFAKQNFIHS